MSRRPDWRFIAKAIRYFVLFAVATGAGAASLLAIHENFGRWVGVAAIFAALAAAFVWVDFDRMFPKRGEK